MKPRVSCAFLLVLPLFLMGALPAQSGEINVAWDPVPGASSYHVYYGLTSGAYGQPITTTTNSATITALQDCKTYFVAVKAFNGAGESPNFSNELSGWSRPVVNSVTPTSAMQGDQIVVDVFGANFMNGAGIAVNPDPGLCSTLVTTAPGQQRYLQCNTDADCVFHQTPPASDVNSGPCQNLKTFVVTSAATLSCNHVQLLVTLEPTAGGMRPAQVGMVDFTVENPDQVFGVKPQAFEIEINPQRFDINQSDSVTTDRIDGKDVVYLSRDFGSDETFPTATYRPNYDFDGNGRIDGVDLSYLAAYLGQCWSASTKSWSLAACPTAVQ